MSETFGRPVSHIWKRPDVRTIDTTSTRRRTGALLDDPITFFDELWMRNNAAAGGKRRVASPAQTRRDVDRTLTRFAALEDELKARDTLVVSGLVVTPETAGSYVETPILGGAVVRAAYGGADVIEFHSEESGRSEVSVSIHLRNARLKLPGQSGSTVWLGQVFQPIEDAQAISVQRP